MAWTKIGENLYMDTSTGAVGELKKNSGGGLFVAGSTTKTTRVEKKYKEWEEDLKNGRFAKDRWQKSLDRSSKPESKKAFMSFRDDTQRGIDETKKEMEFYDNPQEYKGDTSDLKGKHIYKYSTETQEQLDKASSLRDLNTGRIYDKTAIDQYKSRKDGYYYYIDTNVKNRDNPQFETYKERKYNNLNEVDVSKRVKENKIVDSFGNNVVYQNDKGNWVTSRKNYNDYVTGKAERLGGTLALNEKDARETLASYDALEKYPYKGYVADMKSGNDVKYKEQKQANLDKMYKTIGYDDSKYNYGFKKEDYKNANEGIMKERKIVSDWENGAITTDIALKRFKGDKERATKIFESMGYHSPFKDSEDISPMSEYSDTTGTGLSDRQHTTLSKMSLSELRKTAQEYNIDTKGLSKQKLIAKLIAIFK